MQHLRRNRRVGGTQSLSRRQSAPTHTNLLLTALLRFGVSLWGSAYLVATSVRVVNASRVSAGNLMSFLPVAAAPAVPAPAPAAAPIAAPLPPPASAPMAAPPAAPPPINPASRLPLPFSVLPAELVAKVYALPLTVTLTKCRYNFAGVDSRPEACTPLTDNFAVAPLGISTLPPMVTFLATVAEA